MVDPIPLVPRNLSSLQAGRAVAAILVVLFHNSVSIFALPKYWGTKPFGSIFDFGDSGVYFFFVLSGFILLHAHYKDLNCPDRLRNYAWKRLRRIYPVYWITLLIVLPMYFLVGSFGLGFETQPEVILSSFLLLHFSSLHTVMIVSWTLYHEILFYILFALAVWRLRFGFIVIGFWLVLSAISMLTEHGSILTNFYFSHLNLLFGLGMIATWWMRQGSVPVPAVAVLVGTIVFLLAGADEIYWHRLADDWRTLIFGVGATLAMVGLVEMERCGRLWVPGWLRLLGDASYSIYLVHFFVLSALAKLVWATGAGRLMPTMAAYVLLACLAVAAGVVFHLRIERPLLAWLGRKSKLASPLRPGWISPG